MKALICDLDGTLYNSQQLSDAYQASLVRLVCRRTGSDARTVGELAHTILTTYQRLLGWMPAVSSLVGTFGISLRDWHEVSESEVDPHRFLVPEPELARALTEATARGVRLAVVTNNSRVQAGRTLEALGLAGLFTVVAPRVIDELKPGTAMYVLVVEALDLDPRHCLVVGDRDAVDLVPARRLGMPTKLVKGPERLTEVVLELIARERVV